MVAKSQVPRRKKMADSSTSGACLIPFANSVSPQSRTSPAAFAPIAEIPKLSKVVPVARLKQGWILEQYLFLYRVPYRFYPAQLVFQS
jgi:hypothetical protein